MLHAINADRITGGAERWAYVPSMLISKLKNLAVLPFVRDYYVDGQINVRTILSGSKRILVGGLGAGGKGLYALNITGSGLTTASRCRRQGAGNTPTKVNYANPTTPTPANLGYTYGTPVITKRRYRCRHRRQWLQQWWRLWRLLYVIDANTGQRIKGSRLEPMERRAARTASSTLQRTMMAQDIVFAVRHPVGFNLPPTPSMCCTKQASRSPAPRGFEAPGWHDQFATGDAVHDRYKDIRCSMPMVSEWRTIPSSRKLTERVFDHASTQRYNQPWTDYRQGTGCPTGGREGSRRGQLVANQRFAFLPTPTLSR
jgi:hypothetical protein